MNRVWRNPVALVFAGVGLLLLGVALHFNVNPVDGGAVRGGLLDHPMLFFPLAVATIPAMFIGLLVLEVMITCGIAAHPAGYVAGAFAGQFLIYFVAGLTVSRIVRLVRRRNSHARDHQSQPGAGKPGPG